VAKQLDPIVVVAFCARCQRWNRQAPALAVIARPADAPLPDEYGWAVWAVRKPNPRNLPPNRTRIAGAHPAWPDSDLGDSIGQVFARRAAAGERRRVVLVPVLHNPVQLTCRTCGPRAPAKVARLVKLADESLAADRRDAYL
jgi:hypothetical protein